MTNAPTMVRNTTKGPAVFSADGHNVEWAGAGDPMDGHIQPVPASFLENVQFVRMAARGIFAIEEGTAETEAALRRHREEYEVRMSRQANASAAAIDQAPNNDLLMVDCVGPSAGAQGKCGTKVPVKASHQAVQPPLCPQHVSLQGSFVIADGEKKIIGGKAEMTWVPIRLGAPERQN